MLCVLSVCAKDYPLAIEQLQWIEELGGVNKHSILIGGGAGVDLDGLASIASRAFASATTHRIDEPEVSTWPKGANHGFWTLVSQVLKPEVPFLWLEPDAVPLRAGWLDDIEAEYQKCGKPFMGQEVVIDNIPRHMSGIGVYLNLPLNAPDYALAHQACPVAFDVVIARQVLGKVHFTGLIQHDWKPNPVEIVARLRTGAVIYHQDKTHALIKHLRGGGSFGAKSPDGVSSPVPLRESFPPHEIPAATPLTVAGHIAALVDLSKKDGFAKGRIVNALKNAGFINKPKRK